MSALGSRIAAARLGVPLQPEVFVVHDAAGRPSLGAMFRAKPLVVAVQSAIDRMQLEARLARDGIEL